MDYHCDHLGDGVHRVSVRSRPVGKMRSVVIRHEIVGRDLHEHGTDVGYVSFHSIRPLGSSILVPGSGLLGREFHLHSRTLSILPVSVFVLGLGVGPFVLAPASELKGRQPIYLVTSIIFVLFNIGTALSNNNVTLNILRFIAGAAGSSGPSLGAGSIVSACELDLAICLEKLIVWPVSSNRVICLSHESGDVRSHCMALVL